MKEWKHLTFEQQKVIANGISHKYKLKEIAETLDFDPTSISKEVKRNRESTTIGKKLPIVNKQIEGLLFVLVVVKNIIINVVLPNTNMIQKKLNLKLKSI